MEKKDKILIAIGIIIIILLCILIGITILKENKESVNSAEKKLDETSVTENNSVSSVNNDEQEATKEENIINKKPSTNSETVKYNSKDNTVINNLESSLKEINESENDETFSVKAKQKFIEIVDFLFYDGTINDVTFSELTEKGKKKVLELANKIDMAIEKKAPGYKEKIASGTGKAFNAASEIIKNGAENINDFAKDKLSEEDYNAIISAKDELVTYSKNAFNAVKSTGGNILSKAKEKLNNWYQNFKNSN